MNAQETKVVTDFLSAYDTMRKYQKQFFNGNKSALKTAIYWENQTDNFAKKVEADMGITVNRSKGNASQGRML